MKSNLFIFFIILGLFCFHCSRKCNVDSAGKTTKDQGVPELPRFINQLVSSDTLALNTDTLLYFQKSACFGFCPTFNYTIYQNGMIRYKGEQFIEPSGTRYGLITDDWWKQVLVQIQQSKFFELANLYPIEEKMYIPDLPNTTIIIKEYGKRKSVIDNHNAPKELKDFELFLLEKFKEVDFDKLGKK